MPPTPSAQEPAATPAMLSVEEARARVLRGLEPLGTEQVSIRHAAGRILAADVAARRTHPPSDCAVMDGWAVRAADARTPPVELRIVGESRAGAGFSGSVGPGEAARIFTGAPMPAGADTVVMQEDASPGAARGTVRLTLAPVPGKFIRRRGMDFTAGDAGLSAGRRLSARDIGLLAAMNAPWATVHRRPRVAILPTGDEVVMPGDPMGPDQITSSNSLSLAALVEAAGGEAILLSAARDSVESLRAAAARAAGAADVLVTTGGASVGEYDLVRDALRADGFALDFWKVAMKPGKPIIHGHLRGTPVLGLPGSPVSCYVCAVVFLLPMLARMAGLPDEFWTRWRRARVAEPLSAVRGRATYTRARVTPPPDGFGDGNAAPWVAPLSVQDSSVMSALARADGLVARPAGAPAAATGDWVDFMPFPDGAPL